MKFLFYVKYEDSLQPQNSNDVLTHLAWVTKTLQKKGFCSRNHYLNKEFMYFYF